MLRSIDFKTMPYLFTDKAGTCLTVEFDGRELEGIYKQVKAMYDQENPADTSQTAREEPMMNDVKDKTLHEVIGFLEKEWDAANNASDNPDEEVYDFYDGMTTAYEHVINYCRHMLGYSGTMPSEVPNQSEDAKE